MFVFKGEPVRTLFFCLFFLFGELLKEKYGLTPRRKKKKEKLERRRRRRRRRKKKTGKTLGVVGARVCVLGGWVVRGGKEKKKKYLALVRNGGLNHLLKIFNDISVFLV